MPGFPIVSGTFDLPANLPPQRLQTIALTAQGTQQQPISSVTILRPDGTELWAATGLPAGSATSLTLLNFPHLDPGTYTIVVTGKVTGTVTANP